MTISEKVAYLKGLAEGLAVDETSKEGKLFATTLDILSDLAVTVEDLDDAVAELTEQVDTIDEDLDTLEGEFYDDEDDDSLFEVSCPNCEEDFYVDEAELLDGSVDCPACGEHLDFDIEDCDDECGCCECEPSCDCEKE